MGGRCATLAAQVKHVTFYLDVLEKERADAAVRAPGLGQDLRETRAVTPEEWEALKPSLRVSYDRIKALISETPAWSSEEQIGGAMAAIVHTAYHLGEIRQALCCLKP